MSFGENIGKRHMSSEEIVKLTGALYDKTGENGSVKMSVDLYDQWAPMYDKDEAIFRGENGFKTCAGKVKEFYTDKSIRILDVAAGTGSVGEELRSYGFENLDGLDPSQNMIAVAKEKNVYKNYYVEGMGDKRLDIDNGTYDCITCSGGVGPCHIEDAGMLEMSRLVKKGGYLIIAGAGFYFTNESGEIIIHGNKIFKGLLDEGVLELVSATTIKDYIVDKLARCDGVLIVFKVL